MTTTAQQGHAAGAQRTSAHDITAKAIEQHSARLAASGEIDAINRSSHYNQGDIEAIDAMRAAMTPEEFRGFLKGSVMKYAWRLGRKDAASQDAGKLAWYALRLQQHELKQEGA